MSDAGNVAKNLRERLAAGGDERLGRALSEVLESPVLTGAIGRAFDAREKAAQAQELAMGALNIPSAADIERLTRRLRSVSQRLEDIEDGVHRLDRSLASSALEARLSAAEERLAALASRLDEVSAQTPPGRADAKTGPARSKTPKATPGRGSAAAKGAGGTRTARTAASGAGKPKGGRTAKRTGGAKAARGTGASAKARKKS